MRLIEKTIKIVKGIFQKVREPELDRTILNLFKKVDISQSSIETMFNIFYTKVYLDTETILAIKVEIWNNYLFISVTDLKKNEDYVIEVSKYEHLKVYNKAQDLYKNIKKYLAAEQCKRFITKLQAVEDMNI